MKVKQPLHLLKQEITKVYNSFNQDIFGIGVRSQRIEFLGDKILITAVHKRIPALKILDETHRLLTRTVDIHVIDANKQVLAEKIEEITGIPVVTILKDYDPYTEIAATVVILESSIEESENRVGR